MFEDRNSIKNLSLKYEFIIESEHEWNFNGFTGRRCIVSQTENGLSFINFVE
jgi:hypothetical protein